MKADDWAGRTLNIEGASFLENFLIICTDYEQDLEHPLSNLLRNGSLITSLTNPLIMKEIK